jgi:prolyl-tRNA synthetase
VQSYRDLPLLYNQWNSVVRWEMRTKLFLRTMEFFWQEGHTAHATREEAEFETRQQLDIYADFAINDAAVPVIPGRKSDSEKFAGADTTYALEALMGDCKALQFCTSHFLGQNFAKAFEVRYLDQQGQLQHCWTTSWGLSTRVIGALIMVHGDDQGLVLPPKLAPYQVVIVPIGKSDEEKSACTEAARRLQQELAAGSVRVKLDERDGLTPGFKFNDWEMRGVPVRMEIGPKDIAKGQVVLARRDKPGKEGKTFVPQAGIVAAVNDLLASVQQSLHDRALAFRRSNTRVPRDYAEFKAAVESGFAFAHWCGSAECEARIKDETKATMRCIPLDPASVLADAAALPASGACIYCSKPATEKAVFARAY